MESEKKVAPWINAVQMLPGRVYFSMDGVLALLDGPAEADLVPLITAVKDAAEVQVETEANWIQNRGIQPTRPEAQRLDVPADRDVVSLHGPMARASENLNDYGDLPDEDLTGRQVAGLWVTARLMVCSPAPKSTSSARPDAGKVA